MITFHWVEDKKRERRKETILCIKAARIRAYELLEAEALEIVRDIYYTIDNITHKLDYYNFHI